jgi:ribosomal protein S20
VGPVSASSAGIFQRNAAAGKKSQLQKDEDGQINYVVMK